MKQGWEIKKLTDVCSIQYGCPFDASLFSTSKTEGMPLIRIRDVKGGKTETYYTGSYTPEFIIHNGDYLIGMDGEFNIAPWQSEDALLNQRVCKIDSKSSDVTIQFVYRFLTKELKRIEDDTPFATVKHLSAKRLNQVHLSVPPLPEQERIVSELDLISGVIEKKKQQLKELDSLAQSIFYEMFGNPDDSVFPLQCLSSLSNNKLSYGSGASAVEYDGKVRYIRITDIKEDGYLDDNIMSPNDYDDKYLLNDGDILFARSGATVGKTYHYKKSDGMAIYAGYLIRFIPNQDLVLPTYIYYYTRSSYYHAFVKKSAQAVAQPNINAKQYGELQVCVPPLSLQQEFASMIEKIERQKELIKQSLQDTETLFDSRMDFYFN